MPAYNWWNEALHGVARSGYATMFPQAIGIAATWDAPLVHEIGDVISTEARAKNNEALRHDIHSISLRAHILVAEHQHLPRSALGPRPGDLRRGPVPDRDDAASTSSRDAGHNPDYFKVIATPKHFAVHSGPGNERHKFDVTPSPHDLWDTYMPAFRATIVDAKAYSTMCAYNAIDGQPACGSDLSAADILRGYWNFQGYVTSDCDAVADFYEKGTHQSRPIARTLPPIALLHGTDTDCGRAYDALADAVEGEASSAKPTSTSRSAASSSRA